MHSVHFQPVKRLTHDEMLEFCHLNQGLFCEMNANGWLCLRQPFPPQYRRIIGRILSALEEWIELNTVDILPFDGQMGYVLPNGAVRFPALSCVKKYKTHAQIGQFLESAPDFCLDFMAPTDNFAVMRLRMKEYIANGVLVCWLIDAAQGRLVVFRNDGSEQLFTLEHGHVLGEALLKGFTMPLKSLFLRNHV